MPHDSAGRRSRFKRTPSGKHVVLGARDIEILRHLYRYRYLRAPQLIAFLKPRSHKRFIERLGDLYHETACIDRPQAQWRRFDARYTPIVYELSHKGLRMLQTHGPLPHRVTSIARQSRPGAAIQFDHAMMIVDALVEVELQTLATPGQRFVPVDEILERAPEKTKKAIRPLEIPVTIMPSKELPFLKHPLHTHIVPDGLYGIEHEIGGQKRYRFFALECERESPARRGNARLSSTVLKKAAYAALIKAGTYREVWGVPNLGSKYGGKKIPRLLAEN